MPRIWRKPLPSDLFKLATGLAEECLVRLQGGRSAGLEMLRQVKEIRRHIHHGKSFESCLLLLDLSRFLKL